MVGEIRGFTAEVKFELAVGRYFPILLNFELDCLIFHFFVSFFVFKQHQGKKDKHEQMVLKTEPKH